MAARKKRGSAKAGKKWAVPAAGVALGIGIVLLGVAIVPRLLAPSADQSMAPVAADPAQQQAINEGKAASQPKLNDALAPLLRQAAKTDLTPQDAMSTGASAPPPVKPPPALPPPPPPKPAIVPAAVHVAPLLPKQVAALPPPIVAAPPPPMPAGTAAWKQNAVTRPPAGARPLIAIVLDDMGVDDRRSREAVAVLQAPFTVSMMTYASDLPALSAEAKAKGDELMLHVPMQPLDAKNDPGPNALTVGLSDDEIRARLLWGLNRVHGIVGANNHMGSRFTEWPHGMAVVLEVLRERGLFYLDSRTTPHAVGYTLAKSLNMPRVARDVFLDDTMTVPAVERQLAETEAVARRRGMAVAIGHPHDVTIAALRQWLPTLAAKGFDQVPITAIVQRNEERDHNGGGNELVQVAAPAHPDAP